MKRLRFRIRTLIIAVAAIGTIVGTGTLVYRRRVEFQWLAAEHDRATPSALGKAKISTIGQSQGFWMTYTTYEELTPLEELQGEWHRTLAAKYHRAARYPWLPVLPDPPEPTSAPDPPKPSKATGPRKPPPDSKFPASDIIPSIPPITVPPLPPTRNR